MFELETGLIFWTTVSFGLMVFVLYRFGLPPVIAMLEEREKLIADSIRAAEESRKQAEALIEEHKLRLNQARQQSDKLMEAARIQAEQLKAEIVESAEKKATFVTEQARLEILHEKEKLLQDVRQETIDLVATATGKLLQRIVTVEDNKKIIEESLKRS